MIFRLSLVLILMFGWLQTQRSPDSLSPSEAYKAALSPLKAARAQQNDLTDADKFALGIGIARASRDCLSLSANLSAFATDPKELLALGDLCLFGQQYEPARASLTKYLSFPQPEERELALLSLARAHLGLNEPGSAWAEVNSLLHDYPYDAQIHFAVDQVIDASEGTDAKYNDLALNLCAMQNAVTLPLLTTGKALEGKAASVSSSVLFIDALRCAALANTAGKSGAGDTVSQLTVIAQQPNWAGTADLPRMQAALERQKMVGKQVPLQLLHGHALIRGNLVPRGVQLLHGNTILLPFTLWSPSAPEVVREIAKFAPLQAIYTITSWSANTGREDTPNSESLSALRTWQRNLPSHVTLLIVPDSELSVFHADSFPAGIVIRDGIVRSNSVLSTGGSERMLLDAISGPGVT